MPNGVFSARPPAKGTAPCFSSVWQPTQPPAAARDWPRFASPCAQASGARKASTKNKSPAAAGLLPSTMRLLLLPEILVAGAAGLADRADLRLHRRLVAAAAHLVELLR